MYSSIDGLVGAYVAMCVLFDGVLARTRVIEICLFGD